MAKYSFYNSSDGRTYFVQGPNTLTREQAQRVFDQQRSAGALIPLKSGDLITPEFQLANGLRTAEAAVLTDIKTRVQSGTAPSGFKFSSTPVTNGITVSNYSKQPTATTSIRKITRAQVTGILAQIKKLTLQQTKQATNLGAGKFALTVAQLERAGYVKPGTNDAYIVTGKASTLTVLNNAEIWIGKNSISSLSNLLDSEQTQDQIQQSLMISGLNQLAEIGINVDGVDVQTQSALAVLAAIDIQIAVAWYQNNSTSTIPTAGALPDGAISNWQVPQKIARDIAYAAEFSATKVNNSLRNETAARSVTHTTDRQVVDSAANQIVGSEKVPTITYGADPVNPVLLEQYNQLSSELATISSKVRDILSVPTTLSNAETKQSQLLALQKELTFGIRTDLQSSSVLGVVATQGAVATRLLNSGLSSGNTTQQTNLAGKFETLIRQAEASAPISPQFLRTLDTALESIANLLKTISKELQFINRVLGRRDGISRTLGDVITGVGSR